MPITLDGRDAAPQPPGCAAVAVSIHDTDDDDLYRVRDIGATSGMVFLADAILPGDGHEY